MGEIVRFLNEWAAIIMAIRSAVTAPLPFDTDEAFVADPGRISARSGFIMSRWSLQISNPQLVQSPLVVRCFAQQCVQPHSLDLKCVSRSNALGHRHFSARPVQQCAQPRPFLFEVCPAQQCAQPPSLLGSPCTAMRTATTDLG